MTTKQRYEAVIRWFSDNMPDADTELHFSNPYELLVSVILSAQCTDKRVNMTTPALFRAFPTPEAMAAASADEIYTYIRSISYPNNKAKNLAGMARKLVSDFNGQVPTTMEQLTSLPGVGRKTANVMLAVAFDRPAMAVDTHVFRVSERIGLTTNSHSPLQTEQILTSHIPETLLGKAHHWLILHGRYVCQARRPQCVSCGVAAFCRYYAKHPLHPEER